MAAHDPKRLVVDEGALHLGDLRFGGDTAKYISKVLRHGVGDPLELSDGAGHLARATIARISREAVVVRVDSMRRVFKPRVTVELLQGVAKGDKMGRVIRQCTELGATKIRPVLCSRSVPESTGRLDRYRAVAEDAVRVSERAFRPEIFPVVPLAEGLSAVDAVLRFALVVGAADSLRTCLSQRAEGASHAAVLVGPEGGLTASEVAEAEARGFRPAHLGMSVFRTETAGPAAVAILQYALGGFD